MHNDHIFIRHALNHSEGKKMILADGHRYRVDGFCETPCTNITVVFVVFIKDQTGFI